VPEREPQHDAHDLLAGRRQQVVAEHRRRAAGGEREQRLGADDTRDDGDGGRQPTALQLSAGDAVDEPTQQERRDEPGAGCGDVQHDRQRQQDPAPAVQEVAEEADGLRGRGDGEAALRLPGVDVRLPGGLGADAVPLAEGSGPPAGSHPAGHVETVGKP